MALPDLSLRRPVATAMFYLAVGLLGAVSFLRLPIDLLPDMAFPTLAVWTTYPDAGPEEVERFVTEPIEEALIQVPGVRRVTSRSREGQSLVRLQFEWGAEMDFATLQLRERLDNLRDALPASAERPAILRSDPSSDPVLTLAVSGAEPGELRDLSEAVFKRRLEQLEGVALAAVTGGPEREIRVVVDPDRLAMHGVTMEAIREALDRSNWSAPGGTIRRGRFHYSLRTLGQFTAVDQIRDVVVARRGPADRGSPVLLRDVAEVRDTVAEAETLARYNGAPAVGIQVYKEAGANTVRVAERVEGVLAQLREEFPEVTLEVAASQATFVRGAISSVVQALLLGGVLAFLVLFLFLKDPGYPLAVGLAIPISVLAAFALLYLFDVSLNIMSLGGLALGVGLLVDNSIVVLENVFRHRREEGRPPRPAAAAGAREVTAAITASTLTTIAVFGPVLYVKGVAGALFADLSLAVIFSLLASLLVALTLLPVLAVRVALRGERGRAEVQALAPGPGGEPRTAPAWHRLREPGRLLVTGIRFVAGSLGESLRELGGLLGGAAARLFGPVLEGFDRGFRRIAAGYERALAWSLVHRPTVLAAAGAGLLAALLLGSGLPRGLMPEVDEREFRVELALPEGTPLSTTDATARRLEELLARAGGLEGVFTRVGRARGAELLARELTGLNSAALEVRLGPGAPGTAEVAEGLRRALPAAGVDPRFVAVEMGRTTSLGRILQLGEADLAVKVRGGELEGLLPVAESAAARMKGVEELADVRVDVQQVRPEIEIRVDQEAAARHGLTVAEVADAIESFLRGRETRRPYTEFAERVAIRVSLPERAREEMADVLRLRLRGVPIGELVRVRRGYGPVEVRREDQVRTVQVLAEVRGGGLGRAVRKTAAALAGLPHSPRTTLEVGGENEEMRESFRSLAFAFGLALFLVYLILAAQFESLIQPFVVLVAVPLAAFGAVGALRLAGAGLNVMSGIGGVILVGIVVNDAIIKVDFINRQRTTGVSKRRAILEAGRLRLRPIVMTTVTTVAGLLPMALGWGAGADLRAPLAVAVIGGLISATFLTLIVVPVVYSLVVEPREPVGPEESASGVAVGAAAPSPGRAAGGGAAGASGTGRRWPGREEG